MEENLIAHVRFDNIKDMNDVKVLLMDLFYKIQTVICSMSDIQNKHHYYKKAIIYIEENYHKPITMVTVAEHLDMIPFYLSRLIHKNGKESFTDMVNHHRIKMAKQLIKKENHSKK